MTIKNRVFSRLFDKEKYELHNQNVEQQHKKAETKKVSLSLQQEITDIKFEVAANGSEIEREIEIVQQSHDRFESLYDEVIEEATEFTAFWVSLNGYANDTLNEQLIETAELKLDEYADVAAQLGVDPNDFVDYETTRYIVNELRDNISRAREVLDDTQFNYERALEPSSLS